MQPPTKTHSSEILQVAEQSQVTKQQDGFTESIEGLANDHNTDTMDILFGSQVQMQCNLKQTSRMC